jgi:putative acetyltransferase
VPEIVEFLPAYIKPALELWHATEHIGLSEVDDQPDKLEEFLQRNSGCSFVALNANRLVGACLCGHDLRRAAIYHLAVDSEFRRTDLGRDLVESSLSALSGLGITKCHAFVFRDNPYAQQFWKPEGWLLRDELLMFSKSL